MYVAKNDTAIKGSMPSSDCEYGSIQTFESGSTSAITKTVSTFEFAMDIVSIMSSTLSALLGVSMFAMPWGFMQSGVVGGSMILSIVAVLSFETARVLLVAQRVYFIQTDEVKGYPEIAATALGPMWHYVVQVATVISCVGGCTGYMIFFGQTLGQIFGVSEKAVLLAAALPLILLSWIRSFHDLTFFTVLGVIAMFISVIILIKDGIDTDTADTELDPITLFDSDRILNYVGPATFLFTIHYCVLSIGEEALKFKPHLFMQQAGNVNNVFNIMTSAFMAAYGLSYCIIALVGAVGFILYRHAQYVRDADGNVVGGCEDRVCQNIILNISPGIMRNIVGVAMSLVIMFSYIVILAPAREHLELYALRYVGSNQPWCQNLTRNTLRTSLVIFNVVVALYMPYFGGVVGTVGGLTDALQCFVLPPIIYRAVMKDSLHPLWNIFYNTVCAWGCITIAYTLIKLMFGLISLTHGDHSGMVS